MNETDNAVYLPLGGDRFESTEYANAGWYEQGQHGGALAGLIVGRLEEVPTLAPMQLSRLTVEIFRVVPLVTLAVKAEVIREGKRIQSVSFELTGEDDTVYARALAQRLRVEDLPVQPDAGLVYEDFPGPSELGDGPGPNWGPGAAGKVMFHRDTMEVREAKGGFAVDGPSTAWFRLRKDLIAGRPNSPAQRVVAAADFANGISRGLDMSEWVFMNPDLTIHLSRYPDGEWVALSARSHYQDKGRGVAEGDLFDSEGWLGRSAQTLYLDRLR